MERAKIYFDTNIVLDMIDPSRHNHIKSIQLLKKFGLQKYQMYISEDMLSTIYYISKDKTSTLEFFENIIFIDWKILAFGTNVIKNATQEALQKNLDLEDVLQCLCAKENGCQILITNDKKFYDCGLEILSAEAFLEKYDD
jgi:predicted nucleic acid-binding protein